jgi:hypothetical protein
MMRPALRNLAIIAIVVLGACADMQWTKPGVDAAGVERELADCRMAARQRVLQQPESLSSAVPQIGGPAGASHPVVVETPVRQDDRFLAEHGATRACMQQRGYQIKPAG